MPAPLILERLKDRTAHQIRHYLIKPTNTKSFRLWRYYDQWKPIKEFATREAGEDYLATKLPKIDSPEGPRRT